MRVKASFSLFEVLLVISLVLIVVTITVPARFILNDFFLQSEVERLGVFYKYLQMRAMASGKPHVLIFNLQDNSCSCQTSKTDFLTHKLENGIKFGFMPGAWGPPARPVRLIEKPINLDKLVGREAGISDLAVTFYANGKIAAGSVYFVDSQNKNMGALTCSPSRVSYIRKYSYKGKNWVLL